MSTKEKALLKRMKLVFRHLNHKIFIEKEKKCNEYFKGKKLNHLDIDYVLYANTELS